MKIKLFGYALTVSITKADLVTETEKLARSYSAYGDTTLATKIARIKAYRNLTKAGLKESKDWVESHFAD